MNKSVRTIILGLDLDGAPIETNDPLFVQRMGPSAFLDFLEIHCGIVTETMTKIERIAVFLGILAENIGRFPSFQKSWMNAPFATARRLLEWIDTWYLSGWNGTIQVFTATGMPEEVVRIHELAFLESSAGDRLGAGIGKRLLKVAAALRSGIGLPLASVEILDDMNDWPIAWQRMFALLPCSWKSFSENNNSPTVSIFQFDSALSAGRYLASMYEQISMDVKTCCIYEADSTIMDEILFDTGRPQTGSRGASGADSASQILPLALSLHRNPPNMSILLSFLSLPICPVGHLRIKLARTIAASGGIFGDAWNEAIEDERTKIIEKGHDPAKLDLFLKEWIPDERYGDFSFPRRVLLEKTALVLQYLENLGTSIDVTAAISRTILFHKTLNLLGPTYENLNWSIIEDILAMVASVRNTNILNRSEAGALRVWDKPGAVCSPCENLVWYMPKPSNLPVDFPWSMSEKNLLSTHGCVFSSLFERSSRSLRIARRVLNLAAKNIVLILPSVRSELSLAELILRYAKERFVIQDISGDTHILRNSLPKLEPVKYLPLPKLNRWWKIPVDAGPSDKWKNSYSQTQQFITRPAQWLLERKAKIQAGTILSLPDLPTYTGTCAHRLVEALFFDFNKQAIFLSVTDYDAWFEKTFPLVLEKFAYPYTSNDAVHERVNFHDRLHSSVRTLCQFLKEIKAINIQLEQRLEGDILGAYFIGSADLVFDTPSGKSGIIDMKYSGWIDGFIEKLQTDTDIQLTIYAELFQKMKNILPETAYWLFPREKLVARNSVFYPGAVIASSRRDHQTRLSMIAKSIEWRKKQIAAGRIEVVSVATTDLVEVGKAVTEFAPPGSLPKAEPYDAFDQYLDVYGWSEMS